ncbi:hypothetical protein [Tunturiibacter gelidiferens]|uniref:hypothetical protein n=1 Tax=Tunturiibacter gelidiferens TaxID=3069689 RepID=UPI003D9AD8F6
MLGSTPNKADSEDIAIKDVAELLLEGVRRSKGLSIVTPASEPATSVNSQSTPEPAIAIPIAVPPPAVEIHRAEIPPAATPSVERKKWQPKSAAPTQPAQNPPIATPLASQAPMADAVQTQPTLERKKWQPKTTTTPLPEPVRDQTPIPAIAPIQPSTAAPESESASIQDVQPHRPNAKSGNQNPPPPSPSLNLHPP